MMQLKNHIKFILSYIFELIIENPVKSFFFLMLIISFYFAGSFPSYESKTKIEKEIKLDTGYAYLYQKISDNDIKYEMMYSKSQIKIDKDGYLHQTEYHGANVLFWVIFVISLVVIFVGTITDEGWEFSDVYERSISNIVYCEIENGEYVYMMMGRLIGKSQRQVNRRYICGEFGIRNFRDIYACPKYQTKSENRNKLLNKLGIS